MQPIITNSYLVEVSLGTLSVGKTINFLYQPELENVNVYGIQVFTAADIATSPNGAAVVPLAAANSIIATFVVGDQERLTRLPVLDIRSASNAGFIRMYDNLKINFTKSYITLVSNAGLTNDQALIFNFIYR